MDGPDFAAMLTGFRERARMSQSRLARFAGFDHSYLSRLEAGVRRPSRETVQRLSDVLELSKQERDELSAAAGFSAAVALDPVVRDLSVFLADALVPEWVRESVRESVRLVVEVGKAA